MFTSKKLIFTSDKTSRDEVLKEISVVLEKEKIAKSSTIALKDFISREKQITTGVGDGIAIPHCLTNNINETKILVVKLKNKID
jgi:PTS system fructose-specific IIC component